MESDSVVPIPPHLREPIAEVARYRLRAASDRPESDSQQAAVKREALVLDAFENGRLTPRQTAMLAGEAAAWLEPMWPEDVGDVEKAHALLETTRELLELRDSALTVAGDDGEGRGPRPAVK